MLKAPPIQTATATIDTLSGRLESATLLEDRRAAILGLRSFAKQFPASVASGALRELISTLKRDGLGDARSTKSSDGSGQKTPGGGDVDTIRLVLETLLMLFNPDANSPEAGDEIAFFLADEFSMRQENILILLSLLDPTSPLADYYSRLYAVQLLSAIGTSRPERLQECILAAPLGVSRLVGVLDDGRDAVRNAGLLLLVDLTAGANEDLRKIVVFEDVFGKIFALLQLEGGLAEAGITAQDCLSLLANLVKSSASNQKMFRESGCVTQLIQLLTQVFPSDPLEATYLAQSREKAAWGLLQLVRLFLIPGEAGTLQNQTSLFRAGAAQVLIDIGYFVALPVPIRISALKVAAALIELNPPLQEQFAALTVVTPADAEHNAEQAVKGQQPNGASSKVIASNKNSARASMENRRTYVIEALLDLSLNQPQAESTLRIASCSLTQAYLTGHERIKAHFLQRAIAGHAENETAANVLVALLHPPENDSNAVVCASWIVQDLVADNTEAKAALVAVQEGNEDEGEDVLTSIQILASVLQNSLQSPIDERLAAAYASLLTTLLWDFAQGVDELLTDGSSLMQTLVGLVRNTTDPVVSGLAAVLLGTIYEFSTKDSPIPRRTLAPLLQQKLGRANYLDALLQLRRQPAIRDFDLSTEVEDSPDAMLSQIYVELFAMEFSRLRKAIDKDPGIEVLPISATEAGVDRDVLDDLRQQLESAKTAMSQAQQEAQEARQKAEQDRMTISKETQTAKSEVQRLQKINYAMQQGHEGEIEKLEKQHEQQRQTIETRHKHALADAKKDAEKQAQTALRDREAASVQKVQDYEKRLAELGNTHRAEASGHASARQQLETLTASNSEAVRKVQDLERQVSEAQRHSSTTEQNLKTVTTRASDAESELKSVKGALESRTEEVERLNLLLNEYKEELKGREEELRTERSGFADLERELEAAKEALTKSEEKVKAAEAVRDSAEERAKVAEKAHKDAGKSSKAAPRSNKAEKEDLEKLESNLKAAQENEKSAKEELESMLLLMGDMESARDRYKAKVKELGGEISNDEDEDDEEDDEEEEDGDVD